MKLFEGQAIMVDLLLGIPLVLMLAVVVYATIYWFIKLLIIYLLPHAVVPADQGELPDSLEDQAKLEEEFGQEYWRQIDESNKESMPDNSAPSMPVIEPDAEQKKDSHKSVESEESVQTLTNQHKS
ncbi:hypothetical protein [Thiomicrorhabdus sp.]|uniref:hypothetical protein n=1 Tax=Thiomicrorhabdus sp. TaxID=2039724 RepID=UPI00356A9B46